MDRQRSMGVAVMSWGIIASNAVFLIFNFVIPRFIDNPWVPQVSNFVAIVAVFPFDFFHKYFSEFWALRLAWTVMMIFFAYGILRFNPISRMCFIVFNITHIVVLTYIVILHYGQAKFLDYFFKLYFNCVAGLVYVGFLTTPEVREQFRLGDRLREWRQWFQKTVLRQAGLQDPGVYFNLGLAYDRLGRAEDAVKVLVKAIHLKPSDDKFRYHLGVLYLRQKNYVHAVNAFKEAIRLNPVYVEAYYEMAQAYQRQGCDGDAIKTLEKISFLRPNHHGIFKVLGQAYASVKRFDDALKSFERVAKLTPQDAEVYFGVAAVLTQQEKWDEARDVYKKVVRLNPTFPGANFQLGCVYLKLNQPRDAIRSFKDAVSRDPGDKQAHYQLGFAYAMIQDFDSARREYKLLKEMDPDLADTLAMLIK